MYTYHEAIIDPKMDLRTKDRRTVPIDDIDIGLIRLNIWCPENVWLNEFLPPQTHLPNSFHS